VRSWLEMGPKDHEKDINVAGILAVNAWISTPLLSKTQSCTSSRSEAIPGSSSLWIYSRSAYDDHNFEPQLQLVVKIVRFDYLTNQRPLNTHRMHLTTAQPIGGFQLHPKVSSAAEKGNGVQTWHDICGQRKSTIDLRVQGAKSVRTYHIPKPTVVSMRKVKTLWPQMCHLRWRYITH
jgi:hypothetical protein